MDIAETAGPRRRHGGGGAYLMREPEWAGATDVSLSSAYGEGRACSSN